MAEREIPVRFVKKKSAWRALVWTWQSIRYVLGLTGTLGAIYIASLQSDAAESQKKAIAALIVGASAALATLLRPAENARAFTRAWRKLELAGSQYLFGAQPEIAILLKAEEEGEGIIEQLEG